MTGQMAGLPANRRQALMHNALLYGGQDEFLAAAVPFLRDGLEADGTVLAIVSRPNIAALRDSLGLDGEPIEFADADRFYRHPVRTIARYSTIVRRSLPNRVWALAEPVWHGRTALETTEWKRYESVVNIAFATSGAQVICGYDTREVEDHVIDAARRTHPIIVQGQGPYSSRGYLAPDTFGAECDRVPLPDPPIRPDVLALTDMDEDFRDLRDFVGGRAHGLGMPAEQVRPFLMAVCEVATNAVRHGAPPMEVRVWPEAGALVVEVVDYGHWRPGPLIGHLPPEPGAGIGLWGVRLMADTVELRTGWSGTTVRLRARLGTDTPGEAPR